MNKKLFLAGVALLAAIGFTSCNSDMPIDSSNPSGIAPTVVGHEVGIDYDWKAIVNDYAQLQDFWAKDKAAVAKLLADNGANTVNVFIGVANYELKNEIIYLPNFWNPSATNANGKVVNIIFAGDFKNADFERAHAIEKNDVVGDMSKFPVRINTDALQGAEVNFTFDVEQFDLYLESRETRSTFSGDYTIGYMLTNADKKMNDAIEVKSGTIEGIDVMSTGNYKGTIDGVWTRGYYVDAESGDGIQLVDQRIKAKNVYVEANATIDNDYWKNNKWNTYDLGTVKFVKACTATLGNDGTSPVIEAVVGFDKSKCILQTSWSDDLDNIGAIEKTTVNGNVTLIQDVYTDVEFANTVTFESEDVRIFDDVTFHGLNPYISADEEGLIFNNVNFWNRITMRSAIGELEVAKTQSWTYQWIIDTTPLGGHFEEVTWANPLLDANKDKEVVEVDWNQFVWDDPALVGVDPAFTGSRIFIDNPFAGPSPSNAQIDALNKNYVVKVTRTWTVGTIYIPEDVLVVLDDKCQFSDGNATGTGAKLSQTNQALNYVWGDKELYDEECWYNVNYAGVDHYWKKAWWGHTGAGSAYFALTPVAGE
jgi:hypothetical protein